MAKGKVKWFNNAKGYGFILPDSGTQDLFAHYSAIQMEGYKTLKAGQDVEFEILDGPKGQHAVNIRHQAPDEADAQEASASEAPDDADYTDDDEAPASEAPAADAGRSPDD